MTYIGSNQLGARLRPPVCAYGASRISKATKNAIFRNALNYIFIFIFYAQTCMKSSKQASDSKNGWFQSDLCKRKAFPRQFGPNSIHSYGR
jgi:hypothetical protein